jgi:hypothetical protein
MATWQIDGPQRLPLDGEVSQLDTWLAHGRLRVVGTDGPARVEVRKVGRRGVTVTFEDGLLSIRHPMPQDWHWTGALWWFGVGRPRYHADVTVAVPSEALATLTVVSGSVVASGLRHGATVDVTSGHITLMGLGGTVRAKTISGSIEALGLGGDVRLQTVSGEISLADSSAERLLARTISGSVTCDLGNPYAHEVRIDTTSGRITVRVPEDADLDVSLNATSGRVTSAFPQVRTNGSPPGMRRSASGRIGSGTGMLNAYAVSGSVSLLARPSGDGSPSDGSPSDGDSS